MADQAKHKHKKPIIIIVATALLLALSLWIYHGNTTIGTTHMQLGQDSLPPAFDGFTIAHISDLHNAEFGENQERLVDALQAAAPDIIVISGDLVDSRHTDVDTAVQAMRQAVAIAPVYYVTGNHESRLGQVYDDLEVQLRQAGVHVLRNAAEQIERDGQSLRIIGLDDPGFAARQSPYEDSSYLLREQLLQLTDAGSYTILLCHRPELFEIYCQAGVNLAFTGHAHGGQVRLPGIGAVVAPDQGLFPEYAEGSFTSNATTMVVSRGLGNSLFPFRINNPPELVVVKIDII